MQAPRDDPRPAGLVAGSEAGPVIAVEILIEQQAIAPVRVLLELPGAAMDRTPAIGTFQEDAGQPGAISSAT